jgi:hypothetical protein
MSWKLSTLAIALLGFFSSSLAAGQNAPWKAGQQSDPATVSRGNTTPTTAASQSDKELIEKQKTCPVTDEPLGSMGKPVKVVAKGRTVFLCCAGCKRKFFANVDKYLKKLDEQNGETK